MSSETRRSGRNVLSLVNTVLVAISAGALIAGLSAIVFVFGGSWPKLPWPLQAFVAASVVAGGSLRLFDAVRGFRSDWRSMPLLSLLILAVHVVFSAGIIYVGIWLFSPETAPAPITAMAFFGVWMASNAIEKLRANLRVAQRQA